jgi:hypothetical protein
MTADRRRLRLTLPRLGVAAAVTLALAPGVGADLVFDPAFADHYTAIDLGAVPGVPAPYGGLVVMDEDADTLLIGGAASTPDGAIYRACLVRGCDGEIIGFAEDATRYATASRIDGGLAYGRDGVLVYTTHDTNTVGQILPGDDEPDRVFDLADYGVEDSTGGLACVPGGYPGAGGFKLTSRDGGGWYDVHVGIDGAGKPYIEDVDLMAMTEDGPEGAVYVAPPSPGFDRPGVLVAKLMTGSVDAYDIDRRGDPRPETRQEFLSGLTGARGATVDPLTGDALFTTNDGAGARLVLVRGFMPACAADLMPVEGDGTVDIRDLVAVLGAWGAGCGPHDLDRDGTVGVGDMLVVLSTWGSCR